MSRLATLSGIIASSILLVACASEPRAQPRDVAGHGTVAVATSVAPSPTASSVSIDDEIMRACDRPTPRFDFDSSRVRDHAAVVLDKLADCFKTGPLKGRSMKLVGHADPRGETEYNFGLGQRRAGMVGNYLEAHGILPDRIKTTSRGELDAVGTDETGWALDRRVDIHLAD